MKILILGLTYAICIATQECNAIRYIDIPVIVTQTLPQLSTERRFMAIPFRGANPKRSARRQAGYNDERDLTIKTKISALVDQMLYDTDRGIKHTKLFLTLYTDSYAYKTGVLMSQIKRNRDVMNELFDVAVKHKDQWTAMDILKFYELILTVSVETNILVDALENVHKEQLTFEAEDQKQIEKKPDTAEPAPQVTSEVMTTAPQVTTEVMPTAPPVTTDTGNTVENTNEEPLRTTGPIPQRNMYRFRTGKMNNL